MERRPLVLINGRLSELPLGDTIPGGGGGGISTGGLTRLSVPINTTLTIPDDYQYVVHGPVFKALGNIVLEGTAELRIVD